MAFQGYDRSVALSKAAAQNLYTSTPFYFMGFYLGGPCYVSTERNTDNTSKSFTATALTDFTSIGYKLAYIYVGRQDQPNPCNAPTTTNATSLGEQDAKEASKFAANLSVPSLSVIYLDVEGGNSHTAAMVDYVKAWVAYINSSTPYWAGIYCSNGSQGAVAKQLYDAVGGRANIWVASYPCDLGKALNSAGSCSTSTCAAPAITQNYDPTASYANAYMRQYAGQINVKYNSDCQTVDLDTCTGTDPNAKKFT
ncbi:MAG: DUF1906 domain-containing protein [Gorillibacterium sp.]|nr:DUF1906 domain-containing protein [Gorillibacterium sp.]